MYRNSEGYADPTAGAAMAAIIRKERKEMSDNKKTKEYMNQAYRIDQRINAKIEQVSSLHSLATKATSTLSDMPGSGTRNVTRMEWFRQDKNAEKGLEKVHRPASTIRLGSEPYFCISGALFKSPNSAV